MILPSDKPCLGTYTTATKPEHAYWLTVEGNSNCDTSNNGLLQNLGHTDQCNWDDSENSFYEVESTQSWKMYNILLSCNTSSCSSCQKKFTHTVAGTCISVRFPREIVLTFKTDTGSAKLVFSKDLHACVHKPRFYGHIVAIVLPIVAGVILLPFLVYLVWRHEARIRGGIAQAILGGQACLYFLHTKSTVLLQWIRSKLVSFKDLLRNSFRRFTVNYVGFKIPTLQEIVVMALNLCGSLVIAICLLTNAPIADASSLVEAIGLEKDMLDLRTVNKVSARKLTLEIGMVLLCTTECPQICGNSVVQ
jgi:hypothetical protein